MLFSITRRAVLLALVTLAFALGGCDTALDPLADPGERRFSVFGYLNLSADTQFVRVMPLQDTLFTRRPVPLGAAVTLVRPGAGETIALRDSVFRYPEGRYAHNAYTDAALSAGATYRLEVTPADGRAPTTAEATLPQRRPTPSVRFPPFSKRAESDPDDEPTREEIESPMLLEVAGVEHLVRLEVRYLLRVPREDAPQQTRLERHVRSYRDSVRVAGQALVAEVPWKQDLDFWCFDRRERYGFCTAGGVVTADLPRVFEGMQIFAVAAGPGSVSAFEDAGAEVEELAEAGSNVERGVGRLIGIATDTLRVPLCFKDDDPLCTY